ncbi:MAG TPA: PDGLE domain-containing protein [Methanocorpusculum sp.]|nr:PDGLE domain-containing protein [Methanocorpusculum sp.]
MIGGSAVFLASSEPDGLSSTLLVSEGAKDIFAPAHGEIEVAHDPIGWKSPLPDCIFEMKETDAAGRLITTIIGIFTAITMILLAARVVHSTSKRKES